MQYIVWYLLLTAPCFFVAHCDGAHLNMRLVVDSTNFLEFHKKLFRDGFRLLVHDYFEVHCPWSWETAQKYRLEDMRTYIGEYGRNHETLGHLMVADCDDPKKQELIARRAYVARTEFWIAGILHFLFPIGGFVVVVGTLIAGIVELCKHFVGKMA